MQSKDFVPYEKPEITENDLILRTEEFYNLMKTRRSIRYFSTQKFPRSVIEKIIATAGTSPSGANIQPWTFVVVDDPDLKKKIREAAEQEEKIFYESKITDEWRKDLEPLGTNWQKPHLESAPYLIIVFKQDYGLDVQGNKSKHYYVNESVGIAMGILITAIHNAGLVTLTHTPNPMTFIRDILDRPKNEKPVVILPVGFPSEDAIVPNITKKSLSEILVWNKDK